MDQAALREHEADGKDFIIVQNRGRRKIAGEDTSDEVKLNFGHKITTFRPDCITGREAEQQKGGEGMENMETMEKRREETVLKICDLVKSQSEQDAVEAKKVMSGLRLAYNIGYADKAAASA